MFRFPVKLLCETATGGRLSRIQSHDDCCPQEHRQAESSSFQPYLSLLPDAQLTPLSFDRHSIDEIQYVPAARAVEDYQRTVCGYQESLAAAGRTMAASKYPATP
jgi:hypothetical protein